MISFKQVKSRLPTGRQGFTQHLAGKTKKSKLSAGFTIVELLIVIVVIGILAALVVVTYNGIQQKARDTERKTDIKAIHGQLEAYQAQNGKYPTLANMNDSAANGFRATNMKGLDAAAIQDPKWSATSACPANAVPILQNANPPSIGCYGYLVLPAGCDNAITDCATYTLVANLEGGGTYVKQSLN